MSLGQRIRERRQILRITQQGLAQALGITAQHISAIEQDKWAPSLRLLPKLAEELGVSIDCLVSGKEGIISSIISAIRANKRLRLEIKRALIALVGELCKPTAMQAYCVKCGGEKEIKEPKAIIMQNGKPAIEGVCVGCGTLILIQERSSADE